VIHPGVVDARGSGLGCAYLGVDAVGQRGFGRADDDRWPALGAGLVQLDHGEITAVAATDIQPGTAAGDGTGALSLDTDSL